MKKRLFKFLKIQFAIFFLFMLGCGSSPAPGNYTDDSTASGEAVFLFKVFLGGEYCKPKGEIDLGVFYIGSSNKYTFKIVNTSDKVVKLKSLPRITNNSNYYVIIHDDEIELAPYKSYSFNITVYSPNPGNNSADLIIDDSGINGEDYTVHFKGECSTEKKPYLSVLDPLTNTLPENGLYSFRSLYNGQSDTQIFAVRNKGTAVLLINSINISGSGNFILTPPSTMQVNPNSEMSFLVRFNGSSVLGIKDASIVINSNDRSEDSVNPVYSDFIFNVTGKVIAAPEPDISLTDNNGTEITNSANNNKVFDDTVVESQSTMTFNINNTAEEEINPTGEADLVINNIYLLCGGTGSASTSCYNSTFTLNKPVNNTITPGNRESCSVTFKPSDETTRNVKLVVITNDPDESTINVNITGAGQPKSPVLVLNTCPGGTCTEVSQPVDFSTDIWLDNPTGSVLYFRLLNEGTADFTLAGITNSTSFKIEPVTANDLNSIPVEAGKDVKITFKPVTMGAKDEILSVKGTGGYTYNIRVTGNGLDSELAIYNPDNPGTPITGYNFGQVVLNETKTKAFTVKNSGNGDFTLLAGAAGITVTGDGVEDAYLNKSLIADGESATLTVVYKQNSNGTQNAEISINGDHGNKVTLDIEGRTP